VLKGKGILLLSLVLAAPAWAGPPPVTVALVIDTSGSLTRTDLAQARELATGVLGSLPPGSEVAVFSFDDQSRVVLPRTSDVPAVTAAIDGLRTAGSYTALYDALYDASRYLRDAPGARHAILLVTDGKDERSALNLEDGLKLAQDTLVPVICVGVGRVEERILRRIAKLTGGDYFASAEAKAATIAERILAAPETRVASAPSPSASPTPAVAGATTPSSGTTPAASVDRSPLLLAGAGLLLLVAAGAVARAGRKSRSVPPPAPAAPPRGGTTTGGPRRLDDEPALLQTVLTRMDVAGEAVERTVFLVAKPVLAVTRGPRKGDVFPLSEASAVSIGRAGANDIVLEDSAISGQHCRVRPEEGRFVLLDLKSTNGTTVNGRRVDRHVLDEGDVIQVGETSLQFRRETSRG
jgi:FHA domain-containing protein/von Willebrand factor type A domain-containing protein